MGKSAAGRSRETLALVLRRTPYRDADLVLALFTKALGRVSVLARAARKSQKRFGGSLEPLHTLRVTVDAPRGSSQLLTLREARIEEPRPLLLECFDSLQCAGQLLTWLRHAAPEHTPEPLLWELALGGLTALERCPRSPDGALARRVLAAHGLRLLAISGWQLELERCVQTGLLCPPGKAAMIDPSLGGLVSSRAGGAPLTASGPQRARLQAAQAGQLEALEAGDEELALDIVLRALRAHAGLETS